MSLCPMCCDNPCHCGYVARKNAAPAPRAATPEDDGWYRRCPGCGETFACMKGHSCEWLTSPPEPAKPSAAPSEPDAGEVAKVREAIHFAISALDSHLGDTDPPFPPDATDEDIEQLDPLFAACQKLNVANSVFESLAAALAESRREVERLTELVDISHETIEAQEATIATLREERDHATAGHPRAAEMAYTAIDAAKNAKN